MQNWACKQPGGTKLIRILTDSFRWVRTFWSNGLSITPAPGEHGTKRENVIFAGVWFGALKPKMVAFMEPPTTVSGRPKDGGISDSLEGWDRSFESSALCARKTRSNYSMGHLEAHVITRIEPRAVTLVITQAGTALSNVITAQAKALVMNMKQHNGKCGCPKCKQPGTHIGHKQQWPYQVHDPKGPRRTHEETKAHAAAASDTGKDVCGIKNPSSWLTAVPHFDIVEGMAIDYMHGALLGVAKPSKFRAWLLYYSLPIMVHFLDPKYYEHYALFVMAQHILLQQSITEDDVDRAEQLLLQFVSQFESLYDLNGQLTHLIHGTNGVVDQLMRAVAIIQKFLEVSRTCFRPETPARDFFNKIWKQTSPEEKSNYHQIAASCYAVGSLKKDNKDQSGLLKMAHYEAIMRATQMQIRGSMYHSKAYQRVYRHNSFTVVYAGKIRELEKCSAMYNTLLNRVLVWTNASAHH
ncbi:hypothetical protein Bbelb_406410 [Branchiostoma belcheri]|nr:hypothetical protein Bbelb_406410 [Branchiostoma belcheri]